MKAIRLAGLLSAALASVLYGCGAEPVPRPQTTLTIATGLSDGVYFAVGKALAAIYSRAIPEVQAQAVVRENSTLNVEEIQRGVVDLTFDGAGHAYFAYKHGTEADAHPHSRLRAIAVLFSTGVQIVARRDSGIRSVEDFRGKRVAVGARGSAAEQTSQVIFESHGLDADRVVSVFDSSRDVIEKMQDRKLEGVLFFTPLQHPVLMELAGSVDVQLVPIARDKIGVIQAKSPFLKSTVIPARTYRGQTEDVTTVGTDVLLLCRDDLPDQLVHDLTSALFAATPELAAAHPAAAAINADRGPAASIPLHPGAARYYRERELLR